jgi:V/A-type H+-transporting ATPase subunit I
MNKISAVGLDTVKLELVKELMDLGVVEISSQDSKLTDPDWISYIEKDGNENEVFSFDTKISKTNLVIESLNKFDKAKKPMFSTRKAISSDDFESAM